MITDKQIEAAARAIALTECPGSFVTCITEFGCTCRSDAIAALEAAEAAAWCDDIGLAPNGIYAEMTFPCEAACIPLVKVGGQWFTMAAVKIRTSEIKRWRHLPQPTKDKVS